MASRLLSMSLSDLNGIAYRPSPRAVVRALAVGGVFGTVFDSEIGTGAGLITAGVSLAAHGIGRRRGRRAVERAEEEKGGVGIG